MIQTAARVIYLENVLKGGQATWILQRTARSRSTRWGARRFPEACIRFAAVLEQNPRDGDARLYLERAADLMVRGIPETWQPIERLL